MTMATDRDRSDHTRLSRRQILQIGGTTLGGLALGRPAFGQTPKPGGNFISAQTTEATGLDPQLVPALSRSRRSPLMYSQLVRFDPDMNVMPELAESWQVSPTGSRGTSSFGRG